MQDKKSNCLGFVFFFLIILLIIGVGSMFLLLEKKSDKKEKNSIKEVVVDDKMKKDKKKDFIYYENEEEISKTFSIVNKYPIINLESEEATKTTNELKNYVNAIKNTLKNTDETTCGENEVIDHIYETKFLDYTIYSYQEYITLLIRESNYNCFTGISSSSLMKSYTFNVLTGEKLSFSALLTKYNFTLAEVINQIRVNLEEQQSVIEEIPNIKIEETISNLKEQETHVIYIDEFGNLVLNYVVKTNTVDYNDSIIINRK